MECKRGRRAFLNLIRDPVDNYIEHRDEIEEFLKSFTVENDLYELDKELNELGFKTRMGRNCDTGTLSIAVLEEPKEVKN